MVPLKLKAKFYRTVIWPAMLYGAECWPTKRRHVQQLSVAEMRMLRWICGHTRRDQVRNDDIRERLGVVPVEEKLVQHHLIWFGHMQRRLAEALIRNEVIRWTGNKKRGRWRSNLTWEESMKRDLNDWCITKELALNRREWKLAIYVPEPWSSVPSFSCFLSSFFPVTFSLFLLSVLLSFLLFLFDFLSPFFPFFFALVLYLFFTHVVSSLAYPNLLGNKRLGCCCLSMLVLVRSWCCFLYRWHWFFSAPLLKLLGLLFSLIWTICNQFCWNASKMRLARELELQR
jgi:hypothetical protein